ncbi:MAG: hypothetical protein M1829_003042 [Trizodia sp. TS-e1964]|nr:MAG: hypothetical protein M1829_003042 [Trizodia sp. TS-e1964]
MVLFCITLFIYPLFVLAQLQHSKIKDHPISTSPQTSIFRLHRDLVSIRSVTGDEEHVGQYLVDYLDSIGFTVEKHHLPSVGSNISQSDRFNVLAYKGKEPRSRVLVTSHIDTVPPYLPYSVRGDEIWGRGSVDAKASVAAQIFAVKGLIDAHHLQNDDVSLLFVVGEEVGGDGMRHANLLNLSWESVIFGEPTELKLACGHKGLLTFTLHAHGKACHSGYPELGSSAISILLPVLSALNTLKLPQSEKYGNTTINIGRIEGGVAANVLADKAMADVGMRIAEGSAEETREAISKLVKNISSGKVNADFYIEGYGPVDIDCDIPGFTTAIMNYGTDILNLNGDHKRYLYGPGSIHVAHSADEHLLSTDLEDAVKGYQTLILSALGTI